MKGIVMSELMNNNPNNLSVDEITEMLLRQDYDKGRISNLDYFKFLGKVGASETKLVLFRHGIDEQA